MKDIIGLILAVLILFGGCGQKGEAPPEENGNLGVQIQNVQVRMHDEAAPILEALGKPLSYTEVPSCAFEGMEKNYYYGSFYVTTRPEDGNEYIQCLWFTDDSVATEEGVRIGDSREAVEAAYGADSKKGENEYVIQEGNAKLVILLTNDLVTHVQYDALIE